MAEEKNFFIVDASILPEVYIKVMQAKGLLEKGKAKTVQEAASKVGISRSAFYKYRDYIFPFYENFRGRTITIALNLEDRAGVLSNILNFLAKSGANILTINQNIPINNSANATITIETGQVQTEVSDVFEKLKLLNGVQSIKIIARE